MVKVKSLKETVLITGSQSFTATYLRNDLLAANYDVKGLTHTPHITSNWETFTDLSDSMAVCDAIAKIQPHYVIHLAGISSLLHENNEELYKINLQGTLNLLTALKNVPVKKIILASSAYIYGNTLSIVNENTCPRPINHYAMSKLAMEYMALGLYEDLPIVIARLFNYTGVGQKNHVLVPKIVSHFINQSPSIHLGNIDVYREFNDVRMVSKAYCGLLIKAEPGTTINICTGKSHCLREILDLCEMISGHKINVTINPAFIRKNDAPILSANPNMLHSILPDLPVYTLEDTLRWMFEV